MCKRAHVQYTHARTHTHTNTNRHTHTNKHTHTCTNTHTHTHTPTPTHTHTHTPHMHTHNAHLLSTQLQAEFLSYGPKNITVKVYTQANAATTESPSSPPPDRQRAAPTTTPVSATVTAFLLFPPNVSSDVLFVYGGDRSKRGTPLLGRQQRNVFGIYFAQTMLYGHRPVCE